MITAHYNTRIISGFTLVELSIVLVIIGLLVGGVLVGQSLIESAGISSQVSQIQQYDAAVIIFKDKYRDIPGDAKAFGGNGNRAIAANWNEVSTVFAGEIAWFWSSLQPNEYTPGNSVHGSKIVTKGPGKNVPLSKLGKSGSILVVTAMTTDGDHADLNDPRNYYQIIDGSSAQAPDAFGVFYGLIGTTSATASVKPSSLLSLDKKLDDGVANTGNVLSGMLSILFGGSYGNYGAITLPGLATCSSGSIYKVENSGNECTPLIRLGAQTGQPL